MPFAIIMDGDGEDKCFIFEGGDKKGIELCGKNTLTLNQIGEYVVANDFYDITIVKCGDGENRVIDGKTLVRFIIPRWDSEPYHFINAKCSRSAIPYDIRSDLFIEYIKNLLAENYSL